MDSFNGANSDVNFMNIDICTYVYMWLDFI